MPFSYSFESSFHQTNIRDSAVIRAQAFSVAHNVLKWRQSVDVKSLKKRSIFFGFSAKQPSSSKDPLILEILQELQKEASTGDSGAPARAKRAWDRAPYSWNMVNLFSFGCHVIDRAYVRTYVRTRLQIVRVG